MKKLLKKTMLLIAALTMFLQTPCVTFASGENTQPAGVTTATAARRIAKGKCGKKLTWTLNSEGLLKISGTGKMTDFYRIVDQTGEVLDENKCPWQKYMRDITKVVIGEGVTSVGQNAFFVADSLKKVTLPSTLRTVNENAFYYCAELTELKFPDAVTSIASNAFSECHKLKNVYFGKSVKELDPYACYRCYALEKFQVSRKNKYFASDAGVLYNKDMTKLLFYPSEKSCDVFKIPGSVSVVGLNAFCGVKNGPLRIVIPKSVTVIESDAFSEMKSLEKITVPSTVKETGLGLFSGCSNLREVHFLAKVEDLRMDMFNGCSSLKKVKLNNHIQRLELQCFIGCTSLEKLKLPAKLKEIDYCAFEGCENLKSLNFPKTLKYIGQDAFKDSGVKKMPSWLEKIDDSTYRKTGHMKFKALHRQTEARSMLSKVNKLRTGGKAWIRDYAGEKVKLGKLKALKYDYALEKIAMKRAEEIAVRYAHKRPNGAEVLTASSGGVTAYGENLCITNSADASQAFKIWCEKDQSYSGQGHRRIMLDTNLTSVGIACVKVGDLYFWVQEFGYTNSGTAKTKAKNTAYTADVGFVAANVDNVRVSVEKQSLTVRKGKSRTLPKVTTKVHIADGVGYTFRKVSYAVSWTSSNKSVIKIVNGKVKAVGSGKATLTGKVLGKTVKVTVTVAP